MRPTISQLRGWDLTGLTDAATAVAKNAQTLDNASDSVSAAIFGATEWYGLTHDAATSKIDQEVDHAGEIRNVLNVIADDCDDAARSLGYVRDFVLGIVDDAISRGFSVSEAGMVDHPDSEMADEAGDHQRSIQSGLDEAERLDGLYGKKLKTAVSDLAAMVDGQPDITLPSGERVDPDDLVKQLRQMPVADAETLLASLDSDSLRALIIADPVTMGALAAAPFELRVAANEINIRNALVDELQKQPPDHGRVDQLQRMLAPIDDPFASSGGGPGPADHKVDRKFVLFSPDGNGKMIEMVGDFSPGINGVGVIVPGTGTNLNGSTSNHNAAVNIARESGSPIFLFVGGDFPQDLVKDASDPVFARDMAPDLVRFGQQVDREVAQLAPGTPVTYVGHSYGGAILGTAEQLGLRADRILHASSAGTGIYDNEYSNPIYKSDSINPNPHVQRFSMTAPGDPIAVVQSLPHDLDGQKYGYIDALRDLLPHNADGDVGNPLGGMPTATDPDKIPGVMRLDTGYYGPGGAHPDQVIVGVDGHGKYWDDPDSTAFDNIVGVIKGGDVTLYVERGIETNNVDINVGDDGNLRAEAWDSSVAGLSALLPGSDPWGNPVVTDNPDIGPKRRIR